MLFSFNVSFYWLACFLKSGGYSDNSCKPLTPGQTALVQTALEPASAGVEAHKG